jgi:lipopolysaccharide transport system ATP-binding protein
MTEPAIQVEGLSKRYRLGATQGLSSRLMTLVKGRLPQRDSFWALKDVSFDVPRGEVLGVIGGNGAGKSTLLKILSRITDPTEGRAVVRGRVGSLLEVGTGFHPELTGKENIFLSGAVLGMSRAEVKRHFDEIVDFAGIEKFLQTPVKRYSSGMYVRLAFAVAAHLQPEVLIVDEVLAVGDASFQSRCLGRMSEVAKSGRTVLFVSHNMAAIASLCHRAILLRDGNVRFEGDPGDAVSRYLHTAHDGDRSGFRAFDPPTPAPPVRVQSIALRSGPDEPVSATIPSGSPVIVDVDLLNASRSCDVLLAIRFSDSSGDRLFTCNSRFQNRWFTALSGASRVRLMLPELPLIGGDYAIDLRLADGSETLQVIERALEFTVTPGDFFHGVKNPSPKHGKFLVRHQWDHTSAMERSRDAA